MKESSNKMKVNKVMRKINDSSASDAADRARGWIMLGDEMLEGGRFGVETFLQRISRAGKSIPSAEKLRRDFSSQPSLV